MNKIMEVSIIQSGASVFDQSTKYRVSNYEYDNGDVRRAHVQATVKAIELLDN